MSIEQDILKRFADDLSERISKKTILSLKRIKDNLSGSDTGLKNIWDEVCVQKQDEESFHWDKYEIIINELISKQIQKLKEHEKLAIWLQTEEGFDWAYKNINHDTENSILNFSIQDLSKYISENYVYIEASTFKNKRINKFLARY